jgi:hypothetical protein
MLNESKLAMEVGHVMRCWEGVRWVRHANYNSQWNCSKNRCSGTNSISVEFGV